MLPISNIPEGYPQPGVPGTGYPPYSSVNFVPPIHVDSVAAETDDNNDGYDPRYPKTTLQAAVDALLEPGQTIFLHGGLDAGTPIVYEEAVNLPATAPNNVKLIGLDSPILRAPALAAAPALTLRASAWVRGLALDNDNGGSDAANLLTLAADHIILEDLALIGTDVEVSLVNSVAGVIADFIMRNCILDGGGQTTTIIMGDGATVYSNCIFEDNTFVNGAEILTATSMAQSRLRRNSFFQSGGNYLLLSGGAGPYAEVVENYFGGVYSIAGGYTAQTNDLWAGNVTEAGVTAAKPA